METMTLALKWKKRLKQIFWKKSIFSAVKGMAEIGKTNFIFLIMELTWELGMFEYYCGNQPIKNNKFPYVVMRDLESLKAYCKQINPEGSHVHHKIFFFFDEMGKNAPKGTPWAKLNLALLASLQVLRKYHLTLFTAFIGDSVSDLILSPTFLNSWFDKTSKVKAVWHNYHKKKIVRIKRIPKSAIEYDEYADVSFFDKPQDTSDLGEVQRPAQVSRFMSAIEGRRQGKKLVAIGINHNTYSQDCGKAYDYILYLESIIRLRNKRVDLVEVEANPQA